MLVAMGRGSPRFIMLAKFQSLKGFSVGCDACNEVERRSEPLFQSLKGFSVGCDLPHLPRSRGHARFQSLKGFSVGCDVPCSSLSPAKVPVSIPERV